MKCPHCQRDGKMPVRETHAHKGDIYRRRQCGFCGNHFTSMETAPAGLKTPPRERARAPRQALVRATGLTDLTKGWWP